MKKKNLKSLKLNKSAVSKFEVKAITGGDRTKWAYAGTYYCCIQYK
jgi:hypothetical protein